MRKKILYFFVIVSVLFPSVCVFSAVSPSEFFEEGINVSSDDEKHVKKLLKVIAETSKAKLLLKTAKVIELSKKIDPIHPLIFLAIIRRSDTQKKHLRKVLDDSWKCSGFIHGLIRSGFKDRMESEREKGELEPYLDDFCDQTGLNYDEVEQCIENRKWKKLLKLVAQ